MSYLVILVRPRFGSKTRRIVTTQHSMQTLEAWVTSRFPGWVHLIRELPSDDPMLDRASGFDWNIQSVYLT